MDEQELATLHFRSQADGRKVARLSNGKVVLVELESIEKVGDNEWWLVRLRQKESFAIATPLERVNAPEPRPGLPASAPPRPIPVQGRATVLETAGASEIHGMSLEPENLLRSTDRVMLFVDGASTDAASRDAGYPIDFRRARDFFVGPGRFRGAYYYASEVPTEDSSHVRFLDALAHAGFVVRRKAAPSPGEGEGEEVPQARFDADVVLDMLVSSEHYDVAYLFSGSADLERAVETLRARGKRVHVVSCRNSLARDLAYAADKPVYFLEDHRNVLQREPRPTPPPPQAAAPAESA